MDKGITLTVSVNTDRLNKFVNEYKELIGKYNISNVYWSFDDKRNNLILQVPLNELTSMLVEPLRKSRGE